MIRWPSITSWCRCCSGESVPVRRQGSLSCRALIALATTLCLTLSGCAAKKELWYQEGKGQVDYDLHAQECTLIAKEFARQATYSGTSEDPAVFQRTMISCLASKGWSQTPPTASAGSAPAGADLAPLAVVDGQEVQVSGARITLPAGFALASTSRSGAGPTVVEIHLFSGPQETFVNVMIQRTVARANRFEAILYPVLPPFFLYEQSWQGSIFCGQVNEQWVMGLGRYLLLNAQERVTIIVTRPLVEARTGAEPGFQLSREQFAQVEGFKGEWLAWLAAKVTLPPPPWWTRLPRPW